jgi:hypothetical protein
MPRKAQKPKKSILKPAKEQLTTDIHLPIVSPSLLPEDVLPAEKESVSSAQGNEKRSRSEDEDADQSTSIDMAAVEAIKASDRSDEVVIETDEPSCASSNANIGPMCCCGCPNRVQNNTHKCNVCHGLAFSGKCFNGGVESDVDGTCDACVVIVDRSVGMAALTTSSSGTRGRGSNRRRRGGRGGGVGGGHGDDRVYVPSGRFGIDQADLCVDIDPAEMAYRRSLWITTPQTADDPAVPSDTTAQAANAMLTLSAGENVNAPATEIDDEEIDDAVSLSFGALPFEADGKL